MPRAGKNKGGKGTMKQCSLCRAAGREGYGHRRPRCPYRSANMDEVVLKSRFAQRAMETDKRAAAKAAKEAKQAAKEARETKVCTTWKPCPTHVRVPKPSIHVTNSHGAACC